MHPTTRPTRLRRPFLRYAAALGATATAALLCAASPAAWAQSVGTIEKSEGYVRLVGGQGDRTVAPGVRLNEGDKMITTAASEAVVKMADGAVVAVRANTELVFSTYRFNAKDPSAGSVVLDLLKGGLRKVTGLIGKNNPGAVKITTPTATIGIRGTDFEAVQVGLETGATSPGTYTRVFSGRTILQSSDGQRVEVGANEAAFAPNAMVGGAIPFGLLRSLPSGVFSNGRFDGAMGSMQQNMINNWQNEMKKNTAPELQNLMPDLSNLPQRKR